MTEGLALTLVKEFRAWWHQAITWTNANVPSTRCCGIYSKVMVAWILKMSPHKVCLKFTHLTTQPHLPGDNELMYLSSVVHCRSVIQPHLPGDNELMYLSSVVYHKAMIHNELMYLSSVVYHKSIIPTSPRGQWVKVFVQCGALQTSNTATSPRGQWVNVFVLCGVPQINNTPTSPRGQWVKVFVQCGALQTSNTATSPRGQWVNVFVLCGVPQINNTPTSSRGQWVKVFVQCGALQTSNTATSPRGQWVNVFVLCGVPQINNTPTSSRGQWVKVFVLCGRPQISDTATPPRGQWVNVFVQCRAPQTSNTAISPRELTHLPLNKMAPFWQMTFSFAFSWMKMIELRFIFHWNMFPGVWLTISQHWFSYRLGAEQVTSHYLDQWWPSSLTHRCDTRGRWVKVFVLCGRPQINNTVSSWHFSHDIYVTWTCSVIICICVLLTHQCIGLALV